MTLRVSTGLRDNMLDTGSLKGSMDGGLIQIYDGPEPLTADAAIGSEGTNNLLVTISLNDTGSGINFDTAAASGVLAKAPGETWSGTIGTSGTAAFYRHVATGDTGALSTTEARIQGSVGAAGAELNLPSVTLTATELETINNYEVSLPTL